MGSRIVLDHLWPVARHRRSLVTFSFYSRGHEACSPQVIEFSFPCFLEWSRSVVEWTTLSGITITIDFVPETRWPLNVAARSALW